MGRTNKEICKEYMAKFFGPASAKMVEFMPEDECVALCRRKIYNMAGQYQGKEFDKAVEDNR